MSGKCCKLRLIEKKHRENEVFLPFLLSFHDLFREVIGDPEEIPFMTDAPEKSKLSLINKVLPNCNERLGIPRRKQWP